MAPLVYGDTQWNKQLLCLCEARGGTRGPGPHRSALCKIGPDWGKLVRLIVTFSHNSSPKYKEYVHTGRHAKFYDGSTSTVSLEWHCPLELSAMMECSISVLSIMWPLTTCGYWAFEMWLLQWGN